MKHRIKHNQFGRNTNQAKWLYRSLVLELFEHGKIETTEKKAKVIRPMIDKLIGFAKTGTVAARREVIKIMGSDQISEKLFTEIVPRLKDRTSGYTRNIKIGPRLSDATSMSVLELLLTPVVALEKTVEEPVKATEEKEVKEVVKETKKAKVTKEKSKTKSTKK